MLNIIANAFIYDGPWIIILGTLLFFLWKTDIQRKLNRKLLLGGLTLLFSILVIKALTQTIIQYILWKTSGPLTQLLLPPAKPISYFLGYTGWRFILPVGATVTFALFFLIVIYIVRKNNPRLFYEGEEYLAAIALLAVGWPNVLIYTIELLGILLIFSIISTVRRTQYTAFVFIWIPLAFVVLLTGKPIIYFLGWEALYIAGS